jgi:hypothetical protein
MKFTPLFVFTLLIGLSGLTACGGDSTVSENPVPAPAPEQAQQPSAPVRPVEQYVAGEVQEVNPETRTVVLKDTKGVAQTFKFTEQTSFTGAADAKNLSAQEGRPATIRYIEEGGAKSATQIHIEAGS